MGREEIIQDIKESKFYSTVADEAKDVSHKEQLSLVFIACVAACICRHKGGSLKYRLPKHFEFRPPSAWFRPY